MATVRTNRKSNGNGADLRFEAQHWIAADAPRDNMDAAAYKHVAPGWIIQ